MSFGKDMLVKMQIKMAAESITREALVREIKECADTFVGSDGSMTFHSSLTIFAPELTVFLGYNQQQLMMDLTDWYDCGHGPDGKWIYRTKTQGTDELAGVWVNLIGATTPDLLRSTLSLDAIGGGLTSRIVFVFEGDKRKSCPAPFQTKEELKIKKDLQYDLEQIYLLRGEFKPNSSFIDRWVDWYIRHDQNPPFSDPLLAPYNERRPVHVMKLAMILNAARGDDMILDVIDLERSIKLIVRTEQNMVNTFRGVGKSPHADVLASVMQEVGLKGQVTLSELQRKFYHDADSRTLDVIIDTLRSMKFLTYSIVDGDTLIKHSKADIR
jgi:hypothetical protein